MLKAWVISILLTIGIIGGIVFAVMPRDKPKASTVQAAPQHVLASEDIDTGQLWTLVNAVRVYQHVNPLVRDPKLDASAMAKCEDMANRDYWAHNTPDGQEPWIFFKNQGINYIKAGENLAHSEKNSTEVLNDWIQSPEHRDNLYDPSFTNVGYAVCMSFNYLQFGKQLIIVQHFAQL